jgi:hypothetical protein
MMRPKRFELLTPNFAMPNSWRASLTRGQKASQGSAGSEFTATDMIVVFSLTAMRVFLPIDLVPHPNILRNLRRIASCETCQRATAEDDDGGRSAALGAP